MRSARGRPRPARVEVQAAGVEVSSDDVGERPPENAVQNCRRRPPLSGGSKADPRVGQDDRAALGTAGGKVPEKGAVGHFFKNVDTRCAPKPVSKAQPPPNGPSELAGPIRTFEERPNVDGKAVEMLGAGPGGGGDARPCKSVAGVC